MTKLDRRPKLNLPPGDWDRAKVAAFNAYQPAPRAKAAKAKAVTMAEVRRLAREAGLGDAEFVLPPSKGFVWLSTKASKSWIAIQLPTRAAALRVMHAALLAMGAK